MYECAYGTRICLCAFGEVAGRYISVIVYISYIQIIYFVRASASREHSTVLAETLTAFERVKFLHF